MVVSEEDGVEVTVEGGVAVEGEVRLPYTSPSCANLATYGLSWGKFFC